MKIARNEAVILRFLQHPELTQIEIAKEFGITRQRVSQILGIHICPNCYHHSAKFCSCRSPEDMIRHPNCCPDWQEPVA